LSITFKKYFKHIGVLQATNSNIEPVIATASNAKQEAKTSNNIHATISPLYIVKAGIVGRE
jgi:hypothetical protein